MIGDFGKVLSRETKLLINKKIGKSKKKRKNKRKRRNEKKMGGIIIIIIMKSCLFSIFVILHFNIFIK